MLMCICDILYVCVGVYILIGAGALMMVVGFLGCCGAIQESPCMLGLVRTFTTFTTNIKYKLFKANSFFLTVLSLLSFCSDLTQQHLDLLTHFSKCGLWTDLGAH